VTHRRQFGYHDAQHGQEIDRKVRQIVMGIVGAEQKEQYRHAQKEFLGWGILVAVVDLLPHIQVVVSSGVEFEGDATDVVEHQVGAKHVGDVC